MRQRGKAKSKRGIPLVLKEEHHCQGARATMKIDFAKPQPADGHLFEVGVNKIQY
ncbi:MAG: hypothetical protein JSR93_03180 [Verrucomicrobia bacterium]|nr:hypothetical protein [Verrucomicrobiota bacterium]